MTNYWEGAMIGLMILAPFIVLGAAFLWRERDGQD